MYTCTHRFMAGTFTVAIVLFVGAPLVSAAEQKPADTLFALIDSDGMPRPHDKLSFPDRVGAFTITPPVREDRAIAFTESPQQALVPLPSSAYSGLVGLAALSLLGSRKAIARFMV